jgi:hypothetical protein
MERRIAPLRADRPVFLSFLVFPLLAGAVAPLSLDYWTSDPEFPVNLIAEVHGTLLDLLLFGCLLLWFDQKAERRRRIEKYINAIRDLLGWESEMATYRIVGNIRRLNREGAAPETLKNAYLTETDLKGTDLSETSVHKADLSGANLRGADLRGIRNAAASTFAEAETLFKARLDPDLKSEIETEYPELLEPYVESRSG